MRLGALAENVASISRTVESTLFPALTCLGLEQCAGTCACGPVPTLDMQCFVGTILRCPLFLLPGGAGGCA